MLAQNGLLSYNRWQVVWLVLFPFGPWALASAQSRAPATIDTRPIIQTFYDASASMRGFVTPTSSVQDQKANYQTILEGITSSLEAVGDVKGFRFGGTVQPISSLQNVYSPMFYGEAETRIEIPLRLSGKAWASVIITDLFQNDGDTSAMVQAVISEVFGHSRALALIPYAVGFSGRIFKKDIGSNSTPPFVRYEGRLPFYILVIANPDQMPALLAAVGKTAEAAIVFDPRGVSSSAAKNVFEIDRGGRVQRTAPFFKPNSNSTGAINLEVDPRNLGGSEAVRIGSFTLSLRTGQNSLQISPADIHSQPVCGRPDGTGEFSQAGRVSQSLVTREGNMPKDSASLTSKQDLILNVSGLQRGKVYLCSAEFRAVPSRLTGSISQFDVAAADLVAARDALDSRSVTAALKGRTPNLSNLVLPLYRASSARLGGILLGSLKLYLKIR